MELSQPPKPEPPAGHAGGYYALAAFTFAACFVAALGILVVPCALAALVFGFYLRAAFRVGWGFVACQCALVLATLLGVNYLQKLDRAVEQERREFKRD